MPEEALDRVLFSVAATSEDSVLAEASRMRCLGPGYTRASGASHKHSEVVKTPLAVDDDDKLRKIVSTDLWLGNPYSEGGAVSLIVDGVQFNGVKWRELDRLERPLRCDGIGTDGVVTAGVPGAGRELVEKCVLYLF